MVVFLPQCQEMNNEIFNLAEMTALLNNYALTEYVIELFVMESVAPQSLWSNIPSTLS